MTRLPRFHRFVEGSLMITLTVLVTVAVMISRRDGRELASSLTDPQSLCEGTPILVDYPAPGEGGPFQECAFQCGLLPSYFIVYADVDGGTGHLRAERCGKDPILRPGSRCDEVQGSVDGQCDSGMTPGASPRVDVLFKGNVSFNPSSPDLTAWLPSPSPSVATDVAPPDGSDIASSGGGDATSSFAVAPFRTASPTPGVPGQTGLSASGPARCENGIVEQPEECDAGLKNGVPGSFCTGDCHRKPGCGNGMIDPGEQCDNGAQNGTTTSPCTALCRLIQGILPRCGDGILEAGEECDTGASNGNPAGICDLTCRFVPGYGSATVGRDPRGAALTASVVSSAAHGVAQTGPATVAVMAGGAAVGYAWMKRKRRK